jgi:hypothetical protein
MLEQAQLADASPFDFLDLSLIVCSFQVHMFGSHTTRALIPDSLESERGNPLGTPQPVAAGVPTQPQL